jgi:hypothetical protein
MKLTGIEAHPHYVNFKNEIFACEVCGEATTVAVRSG